MVIRETFPVGMLSCNCTLIACDQSREAVLIDPGGDAKKILEIAKSLDVQIKKILHTHAHFDHVGATKEIKETTKAITYLHESDLFLYQNVNMQCQMFGLPPAQEPGEVDQYIADKGQINCGDIACTSYHTPGHTPGSCCFHFDSIKLLAAGDTLFKDGVGRTDLWGGDFDQMSASIQNIIYQLPDETIVVAGHGPETKVGYEKRQNPYIRSKG